VSIKLNNLKISTVRIPFYLVTGFLGSGKTTLLKKIIEQYAGKQKLAIVQNEFAPANMDGYEMKQTGKSFDLLEINNGSVFCVCLLDSFKNSLKEFIDQHNPSAIVMEASGLSDPIAIAQLLETPELKDIIYLENVWCVVDAVGFLKKSTMLTRMIHQVMIADKILINKDDLVPENVPAVETKVRKLNPFGSIARTQYCNIDLTDALKFSGKEALASKLAEVHKNLESGGRPDICSGVLKTTQKISVKDLRSFLTFWADKLERLKGYVLLNDNRTLAVSISSGKIETKSIQSPNSLTEMIAMGSDFNLHEFNRSFKEYT
jgi:G3E family GTPase